jgi:hypothetical protein
MKTRDITLTANLIGLYIAVNVLSSVSPINISSWMYSALFGVFWHYFSTIQNLTFQAARISFVMTQSITGMPKLISLMRVYGVMGLEFTKWSEVNLPLDEATKRIYELLGQAQPTTTLYLLFFVYVSLNSLIVPYAFYRYFKWTGIFRRLPSF